VVAQPDGFGGVLFNFRQSHVAGVTAINRGNPGPWTNYNPAKDTQVVPFFAILN
jgi:hypothetical protein